MYEVKKKDGKTFVIDSNNKTVFSSADDGYIIYKVGGNIIVSKVSEFTDQQLLTALANAVKLD